MSESKPAAKASEPGVWVVFHNGAAINVRRIVKGKSEKDRYGNYVLRGRSLEAREPYALHQKMAEGYLEAGRARRARAEDFPGGNMPTVTAADLVCPVYKD